MKNLVLALVVFMAVVALAPNSYACGGGGTFTPTTDVESTVG